MAMYYYASKISAIACGTRCRQSVLQKSRGQRDRDKQQKLGKDCNELNYSHEVSSPFKMKSSENSCNGTINDVHKEYADNFRDINFDCSVLGSGGIMYVSGRIVSGPLESLIDVLLPKTIEDLDKEFVFSFLLSSRLFIRPHELLGKLLSSVPDNETLDRIVELLDIWTTKFPYDFRDERIMNHVKHIVCRCSNTGLEDVVSEILSALLNRLTDLEQHEENLRACQTQQNDKTDFVQCPTPTQFAQVLCRVERKLAKHVGPEEFVQCSNNVLLDKSLKKWDQSTAPSGPPGNQDPKKTCNLETYLEWSARLRLFVCNEILQCNEPRERSKIVELWSGVAQYCLLVGNYNSATTILESLESPPIARLKVTWSKLSTTCQQLDCMQRHAEGCSDLWKKQQSTILNENDKQQLNNKTDLKSPSNKTNINDKSNSNSIGICGGGGGDISNSTSKIGHKEKSNDWVVIPVFTDIVKLALTAREKCLQKLPNGHINITAFDRLSAIVGAFTKHMCDIKKQASDATEYEAFYRHMQKSSTLNESDLMMASFDCEEPTTAEKLMYDLT